MKTKKPIILILIITIIFVSMACNLPLFASQRSENEGITPNLEGTQLPNIDSSQDIPSAPVQSESFSYLITEAQLTTMLREAVVTRPELGIRNPVAYLRNGIVEIQGSASFSGLQLPVVVQIRLYIDNNSHLQYEIISAKLGPFPMPQPIMNQLTGSIDQIIDQSLEVDRNQVIIETISVDNGVLAISGYTL